MATAVKVTLILSVGFLIFFNLFAITDTVFDFQNGKQEDFDG